MHKYVLLLAIAITNPLLPAQMSAADKAEFAQLAQTVNNIPAVPNNPAAQRGVQLLTQCLTDPENIELQEQFFSSPDVVAFLQGFDYFNMAKPLKQHMPCPHHADVMAHVHAVDISHALLIAKKPIRISSANIDQIFAAMRSDPEHFTIHDQSKAQSSKIDDKKTNK